MSGVATGTEGAALPRGTAKNGDDKGTLGMTLAAAKLQPAPGADNSRYGTGFRRKILTDAGWTGHCILTIDRAISCTPRIIGLLQLLRVAVRLSR